MSVDQSAAESGMERSGLGSDGFAFLAGYLRVVVCWRPGVLGIARLGRNVADGMGQRLRQPKGSAKGE